MEVITELSFVILIAITITHSCALPCFINFT